MSFIFALVILFIGGAASRSAQGSQGAIASNGLECAQIGKDLFAAGGSAVDVMIGVALCEGVTGPQSMGIGGGFLATIYSKKNNEVKSVVARETAPGGSTEMMFKNSEMIGGKASAVPGEILGYWEMHEKYGVLPWVDLFKPTIALCKNGHEVDKFLDKVLQKHPDIITNSETMKEIFWNYETNAVYKIGEKIKRPVLAKTLETIANEGPGTLYNGGIIAQQFIADVQALGGIMTVQDLKDYSVLWVEPISTPVLDYKLYSVPDPGSGAILAFILNFIASKEGLKDKHDHWHVLMEAFKYSYGLRTKLSDSKFSPEMPKFLAEISNPEYATQIRAQNFSMDTTTNVAEHYGADVAIPPSHGTSNIVVLAPNGDAVTLTSTINNIFGAKRRSQQTGIILNDEMDDFATPGRTNVYGFEPSPANYIRPGKRPVSSMSPSIILDKNGNVRLLIGAAGGSIITTSVALSIYRHLFLKEPLQQAIHGHRLHHQLLPMFVRHENSTNADIVNALTSKGHVLKPFEIVEGFSAVTGIAIEGDDNHVSPVFDNRRGGSSAIYNKF